MRRHRLQHRRRARYALPVAVLACACPLSCSPTADPCVFGVAPFDGQTAVDPNAVVHFTAPEPLPADLPAVVAEAAALYLLPDMEPVPVNVEVELEAGVVTLVPREPLQAGREYEARGVDLAALSTLHYGLDGVYPAPVTVRFRTEAAPKALAALLLGYSDTAVYEYAVVFSEAIDLEAFTEDKVSFSAEDEVFNSSFVGHYEGHPNILLFEVPPKITGSGELLAPDTVAVRHDVLAESGLLLDGDGDGTPGEEEDDQTLGISEDGLNRYLGQASCEDG